MARGPLLFDVNKVAKVAEPGLVIPVQVVVETGQRGLANLSFELPQFDQNQDGRIEFKEIKSRWRRRMARQLDQNNDEVIDRRELADAQEKYANQRGESRRR